MKSKLLVILMILTLSGCISNRGTGSMDKHVEKTQNGIAETRFSKIDGIFAKAEYIELADSDKLYIKYSPISDSGIEFERVLSGQIIWRSYAAPLKVSHSKYKHEVWVRIGKKTFLVTSIGSYGEFHEKRDLKTGKLIERTEARE